MADDRDGLFSQRPMVPAWNSRVTSVDANVKDQIDALQFKLSGCDLIQD